MPLSFRLFFFSFAGSCIRDKRLSILLSLSLVELSPRIRFPSSCSVEKHHPQFVRKPFFFCLLLFLLCRWSSCSGPSRLLRWETLKKRINILSCLFFLKEGIFLLFDVCIVLMVWVSPSLSLNALPLTAIEKKKQEEGITWSSKEGMHQEAHRLWSSQKSLLTDVESETCRANET